jgi:phosphoglycolate phosphatase
MNLPLPALVLFDLDGTLVDSAPDIAVALDRACQDAGLAPRGLDKVRNWLGNGATSLIQRALADDQDSASATRLFQPVYLAFMDYYAAASDRHTQIYPGVEATLHRLRELGCRIGCVTNKAERFTNPLLRSLRLDVYFDIVLSGDSLLEKKPHPLPLLHAAEQFAVDPSDGLMVGDTCNDIQAARAAGYRVIGVSYGYNYGRPISDEAPDLIIDALSELPELFIRN